MNPNHDPNWTQQRAISGVQLHSYKIVGLEKHYDLFLVLFMDAIMQAVDSNQIN